MSSNGVVSVSPGNSSGVMDHSGLLVAPITGYYMHSDADPSILQGGRVKFEQVGSRGCVTWDGVWSFGGTSASSARTLQFQFDTANGHVRYVFQHVNTPTTGCWSATRRVARATTTAQSTSRRSLGPVGSCRPSTACR